MVIQNFSAGYRGNGIGYAIKAPDFPPKAPPPPKAPAAPLAPKPKPPTAQAAPTVKVPPAADVSGKAMDVVTPPAPSAPPKASASKAKPAAKPKGNTKDKVPRHVHVPAPPSTCTDPRARLVLRALQEAAAKKRKATAELWLAVEPITAPKKLRGPPKDRSSA